MEDTENSHLVPAEVTLSLEEYAQNKIGAVVEALRKIGASPKTAIVFGSAVRGKKLPVLPRWDIDVLVVTQKLPSTIRNGLVTNSEKYIPVITPQESQINFIELQPESATGWKSPQRGLHLQLGSLEWLRGVLGTKDAPFVHQIFEKGILAWENEPETTKQICRQTGLPLPSNKASWSKLIINKKGMRVI